MSFRCAKSSSRNVSATDSEKGNRGTECWLGFQISVVGNETPLGGADEPILYVFLMDAPVDLDAYLIGFPLDESETLGVREDRLIAWGQCDAHDPTAMSWCFALRIAELRDAKAFESQAVVPAMALLVDCDAVLTWSGRVPNLSSRKSKSTFASPIRIPSRGAHATFDNGRMISTAENGTDSRSSSPRSIKPSISSRARSAAMSLDERDVGKASTSAAKGLGPIRLNTSNNSRRSGVTSAKRVRADSN